MVSRLDRVIDLQNAEDNVYGKGVSPSLELVLTKVDVAKVGAQATLVLFNNEVGFQSQHVEALCAVGLSTKKGKRDSGYIGEKGTILPAITYPSSPSILYALPHCYC